MLAEDCKQELSSRPVWGAWIEMAYLVFSEQGVASRPVWGAWIEIEKYNYESHPNYRRAPYGARGLKF